MNTKRFDQLAKGDVMYWAGSEAGALVIEDEFLPERVRIRWHSTNDDSDHESHLYWKSDANVNLEGDER